MGIKEANADAKAALTRVLSDIADDETRTKLAGGEEAIDFTGVPSHLEGALRVMSEDELTFVARLTKVLEAAELYDEDPERGRVYYL